MAMSMNGYIADKQGGEDFLSRDGWDALVELAEPAGALIIGRKTYEVVLQNYAGFGFTDVRAERIIITADELFLAPDGYHVVHSPQAAITLAKKLGHRQAILTGGAGINSSFMAAELIDEVIINVEPVVMGEGIPLFAPNNFARRLQFRSVDHRKTVSCSFAIR